MIWILLIVISVFSSSILSVLQRITMKRDKNDPVAYAIIFQLLVGIILGLIALLIGAKLPSNILSLWPQFLFMTVLYSLANITWFKALKTTEISQAAVLLPTKIFWMLLGAAFFLRENLTYPKILGAFLIFAAIVIVGFKKGKKFSFSKGSILLLVCSFCYGLAFVNDGYILKNNINSFLYSSIAYLVPSVCIAFFQPAALKKVESYFKKDSILLFVTCCLLMAIATASTYLAYQKSLNVSLIGPLSQLSPVFTVLLGIIVLKEKDKMNQKLVGILVAISGVLLIVK